jgi:hypothetical protein
VFNDRKQPTKYFNFPPNVLPLFAPVSCFAPNPFYSYLICIFPTPPDLIDITMLSNNIMDYYVVSQGKTSIPGVDDGEEMELTDVRLFFKPSCSAS